jgi:hypothetical protein
VERPLYAGSSMRMRLASAALAAIALAPAAGGAAAAKPLTQRQYTELTLKQHMNATFKKTVPGLTVTKVSCVLPKNGTTVKCVANASAPKARESVVFEVTETLSEVGNMSWRITSSVCSDSKTHRKLSCSG